jgi:hypothetical protein
MKPKTSANKRLEPTRSALPVYSYARCRAAQAQPGMQRLFGVMLLAFLAGCASPTQRQTYWDTRRAEWEHEQTRLHEIYRSWFERGFLEAWTGHGGPIETEGLFGKSTDPEGEWAIHEGWDDGQRAAQKARLAFERGQAEKDKQ